MQNPLLFSLGLKAVFQGMNLILLLPMTGSLSALDHASCARKPRLLRPLRLSNTKPETWEVKCEAQHQFYTLGCKVNQSDTASMEKLFREAGYEIVPFGEASDICLINTCVVTNMGRGNPGA